MRHAPACVVLAMALGAAAVQCSSGDTDTNPPFNLENASTDTKITATGGGDAVSLSGHLTLRFEPESFIDQGVPIDVVVTITEIAHTASPAVAATVSKELYEISYAPKQAFLQNLARADVVLDHRDVSTAGINNLRLGLRTPGGEEFLVGDLAVESPSYNSGIFRAYTQTADIQMAVVNWGMITTCSCNTSSSCEAGCEFCDVDCPGNCTCDTSPTCETGCACDNDCNVSCSCDQQDYCDAGCSCDPDCATCACDTSYACEDGCACDLDCDVVCECDVDYYLCDPSCACDAWCEYCSCDTSWECNLDGNGVECACDFDCEPDCECDTTGYCDAGCDCDLDCGDLDALPTIDDCKSTDSEFPVRHAGEITAGDSKSNFFGSPLPYDAYCVVLTAGDAFVAETSSPDGGVPEVNDTVILLTNADRALMAESDDEGVDLYSLINYSVLEDGTYILSVFPYSADELGAYTLDLSLGSQ